MSASAMQFALHAKQREIDSLQRLADRIELADLLGRLIHALQRERGITSIFLASHGTRFVTERSAVRAECAPLVAQLRDSLDLQLAPERATTSRMLSLIAWVLLDLDSLDALRERIDDAALTAPDSVMTFSKVIGNLMELIFQLADGAPDPSISRMLVALVHVVQGKEEAGQERAVGAHMFAAGAFSSDQQQRLVHLIGAQERSLEVFTHFAGASGSAQDAWWQGRARLPHVATLESLRRVLCSACVGDALDTGASEAWFDAASARITDLWHVQIALTVQVRSACDAQIALAHQALRDSEDLMEQWRGNPPPHAQALEHFFAEGHPELEAPVHPLPETLTGTDPSTLASLKSVLQTQSARLARAEVELDAARRALHERKLVQRAKHALMTRFGLSEEAAFRTLQKTSMDRNRTLVDTAEEALMSPDTLMERVKRGKDRS